MYSGQKKKVNINRYSPLIRPLCHFYSNQGNHFSITSTIVNMAAFTKSMDSHVTFSKVLLFLNNYRLLQICHEQCLPSNARYGSSLLISKKLLRNKARQNHWQQFSSLKSMLFFTGLQLSKWGVGVGNPELKIEGLNISTSNQGL